MKQNKKGFTLLEIIIVIIIIGVLAALALPRLFKTVEFSRSAEALNSFTVIRGAMERCYIASSSPSYANCNLTSGSPLTSNLDVEDPATSPNSHFTYDIQKEDLNSYSILATRNTLDGGQTSSTITLSVNADGTITKTGAGAFNGIR